MMSIQLAPGFAITPTHGTPTVAAAALAPEPDPGLGPLALLPGTWTGEGFNNIWRPFHDPATPKNDHFLELNLTNETLEFTPIPGTIPNRGFLQPDITMAGVNYLQQISDQNTLQGLHFEPGMWLNVPATTNPNEPITVSRLASIPHGTVMLAQGTFDPAPQPGPPQFPVVDITPFQIGKPLDPNAKVRFPTESTLSNPSPFRSPPDAIRNITQEMVDNPNSVLQAAIAGQTILETITLKVTSLPTPVAGGGTANTAFLQGAGPGGGNADAAQVDATFWIETVQGENGQPDFLQLQYSQQVLLNFNTLSWPHISVATLRLSSPAPLTPQR
jgi:hypothetical protein